MEGCVCPNLLFEYPLLFSTMYRIILFLFMIILSIETQSQTGLNGLFDTVSYPDKECDTINIDKGYLTINNKQIFTDTNVQEATEGLFNIIRIKYLNPKYSMLYVEHTDTFYLVYDSIMTEGSIVYLIDTLLSSRLFNVLVENSENAKDESSLIVGKSTALRLRQFYNEVKFSGVNIDSNENNATTETCDHCYVIILLGEEIRTYDCPLYNNLYRQELFH